MAYKVNQQQFDAVLKLPGDQRYQHFVGRVADWQQIWSPRNAESFVGLADDEGQNCIPL